MKNLKNVKFVIFRDNRQFTIQDGKLVYLDREDLAQLNKLATFTSSNSLELKHDGSSLTCLSKIDSISEAKTVMAAIILTTSKE